MVENDYEKRRERMVVKQGHNVRRRLHILENFAIRYVSFMTGHGWKEKQILAKRRLTKR